MVCLDGEKSVPFIGIVTAEQYQELITNFISMLEVDEQDFWFQQDGVTTHSKFNSTNVVQILW
jgi:hypothetical protein